MKRIILSVAVLGAFVVVGGAHAAAPVQLSIPAANVRLSSVGLSIQPVLTVQTLQPSITAGCVINPTTEQVQAGEATSLGYGGVKPSPIQLTLCK